jgi:RNA polymerase sigma factor (sigma-70 family)
MPAAHLGTLVRRLHDLAAAEVERDRSDRQLLTQFAESGDPAAFAALVRRHGRLVLGTCRNVLRQEQDAEDAFQAVFLVLARKANAVQTDALGAWLHGVAYRVALRARRDAARRRRLEGLAQPPQAPPSDLGWRELQAILDEEVRRLPEKYRAPFVLCVLQGQSKSEAARQLGWKEGTVSGRLAEARKLLRRRLGRRGVIATAALCAANLALDSARAAVPPHLSRAVLQAALGVAPAAPRGAALAEAMLRAALPGKCKAGVAALLLLGALAVGAGALAPRPAPAEAPPAPPARTEVAAPAAPPVDRFGDALPAGALARLGTVRFRHSYFTYTAVFSPDGKRLATGGTGFGRGVCLWDARTGRLLHHLRQTGESRSLAFSPDGQTLVAAGLPVRAWDVGTGRERFRIDKLTNVAASVAFTPDGRTLAVGTFDGKLHLCDARTGAQRLEVGGPLRAVWGLAFAPDGKTVATADIGPGLRLWDARSGALLRSFEGHAQEVVTVAFAPDGRTLASGGTDGTIRLWEKASGKQLYSIKAPDAVRCVAFAPDGKVLASGGRDRHVRLWDAATGKPLRDWPAHAFQIHSVSFSPDGRVLATTAVWGSAVRLWDVASGKELGATAGHFGPVESLTWAADGQGLTSYARDKRVIRWDLGTGNGEAHRVGVANSAIDAVAVAPGGRAVATGGRLDGKVRLWDAASGRELALLGSHPQSVRGLTFSPDGRLLAASGLDKTITLWDVPGRRELRRLTGEKAAVNRLAFSPDGRRLAAINFDDRNEVSELRLWDVATGRTQFSLEVPRNQYTVVFSADGRRLVTTGEWGDPVVRVWNAESGKLLHTLTGHDTAVASAAFSPDGRLLATGGCEKDNTLRLWELATGQEVRHFRIEHSGTLALAFSPDGRRLASGGGNSTILVWDVYRAPARRLNERQLAASWDDLGNADAARAFEATCRLLAAPPQAVPYLRQRLRPAAAPDPARLARLIAQLDAEDFATRNKASAELAALGFGAEAALRQALARGLPPEARRRARELLGGLGRSAEWLRTTRALGVLERAGAREALKELAGGAPEARLTQEAKAALVRLR